jgi:predicted methyltransferase
MIISPKEGIIIKILRNYKRRKMIEWQDKLKLLYELSENGLKVSDIKNVKISKFIKLGIVEIEEDKIKFTEKGKVLVMNIIKAHELWEAYLRSHNVAEKLEHYTDEEIINVLNEIIRGR